MTQSIKIMIVEDEADLRETLSYFFQSRGYETIECQDGLEAWELLKQSHTPRIILLDLSMPRMNGHQLLAHLSTDEELKKIPVVVVSALADTLGQTSVVATLKKPFSLEHLNNLVSTHLRIDSL